MKQITQIDMRKLSKHIFKENFVSLERMNDHEIEIFIKHGCSPSIIQELNKLGINIIGVYTTPTLQTMVLKVSIAGEVN